MGEPIKLGVAGLGPIGREACRRIAHIPSLELVGAADKDPELQGRSLAELCPGSAPLTVEASLEAVLDKRPRLIIMCTGSRLESLESDFSSTLERGVSVVSSAEELAQPWRTHAKLAARLDATARAHGAHLLGTGVNPGFVMDALVTFVAQASNRITAVEVRRVVDTNRRRAGLRLKTGCGLERKTFEDRARRAELGHIGLAGSAYLVASGLGLDVVVEETIDPVIAEAVVDTPEGPVPPGRVLGIHQVAIGRRGNLSAVRLDLTMTAGHSHPCDVLTIQGEPPIRMEVTGGIEGDGASAARLVNAVEPLLETRPGLRTVLDLPLAASRFS